METVLMMTEGIATMKGATSRRRPSVHITMSRAARLHRLVTILAGSERTREQLLRELGIGLRTFYRELELLKRCGVKVRLQQKTYILQSTAEIAEGKLPFPDPQLSFAEMAELAQGPSPAALRLKDLLSNVTTMEPQREKQPPRPKSRSKSPAPSATPAPTSQAHAQVNDLPDVPNYPALFAPHLALDPPLETGVNPVRDPAEPQGSHETPN